MTAQVIPFRPRTTAGPCNSGTVPGQVSQPCGDANTRLYPCGPRCVTHSPPNRKEAS